MSIAAVATDTWTLKAEIRGTPMPQGAIRSLGKGRPSIHANADRLLPWREAVANVVAGAMDDMGQVQWPECGPVAIRFIFTMKKPLSAPKRKKTWPITRPDLSKLVRAAEDALVNAGALRDDSQVILIHAEKVYPNEHPQALATPGLYLTLSPCQ